jgi:hypothetical protein
MLTTRAGAHRTNSLLAATLLAALALAACGTAAAPSPTAWPSTAPATARPTPTAVPGDGGSAGTGGGGIGTDPGNGGGSNPGTGTGGGPIIPFPPDPNQNPLLGEANYVVPMQNLINQHTVNVQLVRALVQDDRTALVDLRWWSGVAPCNQLDHVEIARDDAAKTINLKVIEGSGHGDVACIDIAELHATTVNLGTLAAGTWTISADGDAPPIPLEVM